MEKDNFIVQTDCGFYPKLQLEGNTAQYAKPFFDKVCEGDNGCEVGYMKPEWALNPRADLIDNDGDFHAMNLPRNNYDWVASCHCLEHVQERWIDVVEYWLSCLNEGGILFLYLPNMEHQYYWAFENKKHIHYFTPKQFEEYCNWRYTSIKYFVSDGFDPNGSFYVIIQK